MDLRNKKMSDDEFYGIRKEILEQWPTGKEVDFDESVAYHKAMPESKSFSKKLAKAKAERKEAEIDATPELKEQLELQFF